MENITNTLSTCVDIIVKDNIVKLTGLSNINESLSTHYLIYRIINNINKKYYIGQHKTNNPYDNYMGSGKLITKAEEKYGLSNFTKEILFDFDNFDEMNNKEKELVQLSNCQINDDLSYNLVKGGKGNTWINITENEYKQRCIDNGERKKIWYKNMTADELIALHKKQQEGRDKKTKNEKLKSYKKISDALKKYYKELSDNDKIIQSNKIKAVYKNMTKEQHDNFKLNHSIAQKKHLATLTKEQKQQRILKRRESLKNRTYVSNDELQICRRVPNNQVNIYLALGYTIGNHTKRWYSNKLKIQKNI